MYCFMISKLFNFFFLQHNFRSLYITKSVNQKKKKDNFESYIFDHNAEMKQILCKTRIRRVVNCYSQTAEAYILILYKNIHI